MATPPTVTARSIASNRFARFLIDQGEKPEAFVGVFSNRPSRWPWRSGNPEGGCGLVPIDDDAPSAFDMYWRTPTAWFLSLRNATSDSQQAAVEMPGSGNHLLLGEPGHPRRIGRCRRDDEAEVWDHVGGKPSTTSPAADGPAAASRMAELPGHGRVRRQYPGQALTLPRSPIAHTGNGA